MASDDPQKDLDMLGLDLENPPVAVTAERPARIRIAGSSRKSRNGGDGEDISVASR